MGGFQGPLIAIVEDDGPMREAIMGLVRAEGFTVAGFDNAQNFLQSGARESTCCLIADFQLPGMTGLELHLFLVGAGTPIPTILTTAYPNEIVRQRAFEAGVAGYLTKPFKADDLFTCIRTALSLRD